MTSIEAIRIAGWSEAPELLGLLAFVLLVGWVFGRRPSTPLVFRSPRARVRDVAPAREDVPEHRNGTRSPAAPASATPRLDAHGLQVTAHELATAVEQGPMLSRLAQVLQEDFRLHQVVVRVLNQRARIFETQAFAGLPAAEIARLSTVDVPIDAFERMTRRALPAALAWRVSEHDDTWPDLYAASADPVDWSPERWHEQHLEATRPGDRIVLAMRDDHLSLSGFVCARGSECFPDEDAICQLQLLVGAAGAGLLTTRLRSMLQRRELEYTIVSEQLRESQSLRDNFVANVSHELRTPLTSVKAYAETLARGSETMDPATRQEFVAVIEHEAERLDQVFDDLLDVAHLEGRARRVARDRVDLRGLVRSVCAEHQHTFEELGVDLRVYGPDEPVHVQGDPEGLRQILEHLLDNARKFTPEKGRVRVELSADAGSALLVVEDTGIGVPEQELTRIFERFYQVDGSATRAFGGQGLGLALCRDIVGWHHGRIWAEGAVGGGARFSVQVPLRGLVVRQTPDDLVGDASERMHWESFLKLAIHLVSDLTQTRVASIMLVDPVHEVLRVEAAVGLDEEVVQNSMVGRGEGVAGHVWASGETLLVPDLDADADFSGLADHVSYGTRSLLSVPLIWDDRVVGVLNVNTRHDGLGFDDDDRLLLEALADRLVIALDHFERYRSGYLRLASVEAGVRAMLEVGRERQTALREVFARIGLESGRRLGLEEDHLRALAYAVRTYDLGLSEVSARILRKVSPLSRQERERIDDHVHLGTELIADLEPSTTVRKMILHHHENVDGSGYPDGLRGEAIPVGARILRLVDALGALLHDRPFRNAIPIGPAMDLIDEGAGTRYCPRITPTFLDVVREHEAEIAELLAPDAAAAPLEIDLGPSPTVR